MWHRAILIIGLAMATGCNPKDSPKPAGDAGKPIEPPAKVDLKAAEAELADLEKAIAAKEKELSTLRAKADALRTTIAQARSPGGQRLKFPDVLKGLPENARPRSTDDQIQMQRANEWLKRNVEGKLADVPVVFNDVRTDPASDKPSRYNLVLTTSPQAFALPFGEWSVWAASQFGSYTKVRIEDVSDSEAERIQNLKGKATILTGQVKQCYAYNGESVVVVIQPQTVTAGNWKKVPEKKAPEKKDEGKKEH